MAVSVFKKFEGGLSFNEIEAYTSKSRNWYLKELKGMRVNRSSLMRDKETRVRSRFLPGRMFMYFYDPKHKATLPYYDRFPLTMVVDKAEGGWYGLNLHYLNYRQRGILLSNLLDVANNDKFDESTKLNISYGFLKKTSSLKAFNPCFKHYLNNRVKSKLVEVPSEYWETAVFIPSEQFTGATKNKVFADSRKLIY
jgi:hypothetical protein